jgi:hypothetical protein
MGEGFIIRRGGGGQQTVKPIYNSVTEVSFTSLTLSVTNDSNSIATLYYSVVNNEPGPDQAGTFDTEFDGKETKDITITGLTAGTTYTVYIKASAVGEFPSETVSVPNLTTGQAISATGGTTTEYNDGGKRYKSHTFTGNGTFTVTQLSNISELNKVEYLVIAGGGSGSKAHSANVCGGGGAGGYRSSVQGALSGANSAAETPLTVNAQSYTVTVGAGGAGNTSVGNVTGNSGSNSVFGSITSIGGGRGGESGATAPGASGGSGGGAGSYTGSGTQNYPGGAGTAGQGFAGAGYTGGTNDGGGGGGGGAGAAAIARGTTQIGGNGGNGLSSSIRTGTAVTRAGGGAGSGWSDNAGGSGGSGGGGNGGSNTVNAQSGSVNTGSGGGAAKSETDSGSGGSGIVIVRYEIAPTV